MTNRERDLLQEEADTLLRHEAGDELICTLMFIFGGIVTLFLIAL